VPEKIKLFDQWAITGRTLNPAIFCLNRKQAVPFRAAFGARSQEEDSRMTRMSLFNSPLLLGFEHFERTLDRLAKTGGDGYPPYNIEQIGDDRLRISIAVAGFSMDDLSVTIEDNQLIVRGKRSDDGERVYLHQGIAARQFQRAFVLADGIEIGVASLDNGLLNIDLLRPQIEAPVRKIEIVSKSAKSKADKTFDIEQAAE
jgi:HSP20 family molecular chaperone IbpA